jgi:hypothetical protein
LHGSIKNASSLSFSVDGMNVTNFNCEVLYALCFML